jgi:hypothetical protein
VCPRDALFPLHGSIGPKDQTDQMRSFNRLIKCKHCIWEAAFSDDVGTAGNLPTQSRVIAFKYFVGT